MLWIYDSFKPFCERNGIRLLKGDLKFIERALKTIPHDRRKYVMHQYVKEWFSGISEADTPVASENWGRRRANSYLRDL